MDSDAVAFLSAASIVDATISGAVNVLVTDLKAFGLWTLLDAVYPFVGGSASTHKWNLKDPRDLDAAYRLTFAGGWTHAATGVTPNNSNGYADTHYILASNMTSSNGAFGFYSRTVAGTFGSTPYDMGCSDGVDTQASICISKYSNSNCYTCFGSATYSPSIVSADGSGLWSTNRKSTTNTTGYTNGAKIIDQADAVSLASQSMFIGACNRNGTASYFGGREQAFSFLGRGLTDIQHANLYNAVQRFQTTLSRQIGTPVATLSATNDPDTNTFLTVTGITDATISSALDILVVSLKGAGLWSLISALYPMVGGTATTHKYNLKDPRDLDAAFRIDWNGGWTHSATGAKPDGTSGTYGNTHWAPITNATVSNISLGFYSRTSTQALAYDMASDDGTAHTKVTVIARWTDDHSYFGIGSDGPHEFGLVNTDGRGFYVSNRLSVTTTEGYKNGVQGVTGLFSPVLSSASVYVGSYNSGGSSMYSSDKEQAFTFMGSGMTAQNEADLYSAVQIFQTSLSRNVGTAAFSVPVSVAGSIAGPKASVISSISQVNSVIGAVSGSRAVIASAVSQINSLAATVSANKPAIVSTISQILNIVGAMQGPIAVVLGTIIVRSHPNAYGSGLMSYGWPSIERQSTPAILSS